MGIIPLWDTEVPSASDMGDYGGIRDRQPAVVAQEGDHSSEHATRRRQIKNGPEH
jgi:hypothetical protein